MYNAPRAATITANEECQLWRLDRETFNHIVKDSSSKRRQKNEQMLQQIPILSTLEPYERSKLSDALREATYAPGEVMIKEGENSLYQELFFLVEGEAKATKWLEST